MNETMPAEIDRQLEELLNELVRVNAERAELALPLIVYRAIVRAIPLISVMDDFEFWCSEERHDLLFSLLMIVDTYSGSGVLNISDDLIVSIRPGLSRFATCVENAAQNGSGKEYASMEIGHWVLSAAVQFLSNISELSGESIVSECLVPLRSVCAAFGVAQEDCGLVLIEVKNDINLLNMKRDLFFVPLWSNSSIGYNRRVELFYFLIEKIMTVSTISHKSKNFLLKVLNIYRSNTLLIAEMRLIATNESVSDDPVSEDKLNRQNLVNALAVNLIHSTNKHHRAIGLLGEWGSGKSTLLKLLKEKLQKTHTEQPFVFGEFNAWAYEHTDNIQAGVAQEMINALTSLPDTLGSGISSFWPSLKWGVQRAGLTMQFSWKTHPFEILKILVLLLIAAIPWFSDWFDSLINNKDLAVVGQWVWTGGLVLYTLREFGKLIISPQAKELLTYLRLPSYAEHLGKIPVMRKHISTLCELRLKEKNGKTPRLLFVVDDLDRCSPEAIVKVLEAVRLVLDLENVIVLIAIDQHIALAALSKHFKDFALHHKLKNSHAIAREYLSKVINLPIVLTAPSGKDVEVFMADLWKDMPKVSPEGASSASQKAPFDKTPEPGTGGAMLSVHSTSQPDNVPVTDSSLNPGLTDDVKSKAPESDQPPSDEINPIKALSSEQQASFIHWVNYFELTNPRQLKRLNNSYDLMRSYFVEWDKTPVAFNFPNENAQPVYPMLLTLILMEHLNSFEDLDARGRLWKKLFPQKSEGSIPISENITRVDPGAFDKKSVSPAFINAYRELYKLEGYDDMAAKVEAFVLPAMV